ncbi:tetratricopeptide repeat protein [Parasulfuritortus cantonensis]|uniref:Tetratricopeptide repeat protein n=1 Tax=Parasulfuritortus cantonensis TaxID=2528202 RepID=A0A4R1BCG6_9PROT|nr:FecR domain-containing protein [Parasulfuritortus cantonensis]TCJ14648.1 tetratricopeptide repeat protein [Parasulfuritortus cantonensis]
MRYLALFMLCLLGFAAHAETVSGNATLIDLQGKVEYRTGAAATWQAATANQKLQPGQGIRTGRNARAALLLSDRTQIRMNENTVIDIVAVGAAPRSAGQSKFRQMAGRAWVQSKTPPKSLEWQTPTAIAGIRGTDWEMAVAEDGKSTLSVFSGEIAFGNEHGQVSVAADEQAIAEQGKAPVKLTVRNLKDRIQWVTAYRMAPWRFVALDGAGLPDLRQRLATSDDPVARGRILADLGRWADAEHAFAAAGDRPEAALGLAWCKLRQGDAGAAGALLERAGSLKDSAAWAYADAARLIEAGELDAARSALDTLAGRADLGQPAPWLMLSDIDLYQGRGDQALAAVDAGLQRFPEHAGLLARKAEILLLGDRADAALAAADAATSADLASYEGWLVRAEIARRQGDANATLAAYDLAIALKPDDDRAWFGRGGALAERDYVDAARGDLKQAIALDPQGLGYQGELGSLESNAAEWPAAEAAYRAALAANPSDYVALTGLGVLDLKLGRTQAALDNLLKAGVMEPRYARVHVYTAVAYWQLGDRKQAREELGRASQLDDKDPLPYFMAAMMASDLLEPAAAVDAARQAMARLPYLKSLNQLANDQQGSANLGQAFAFMGMEDWARTYAQASYSPLWAGSHLFLADRYQGLYTKNSELFQGLIADPTVFGAGNRFKSLVQAPATNVDLSLRYTKSDSVQGFSPQVQFSGYRPEDKPKAWYLAYENVDWTLADRPYDLDVLTAAFGIKPSESTGVFVFADKSRQDSQPTGSLAGFGNYDVHDKLDTGRMDVGFNYKVDPTSQVWVKAGYFASDESTAGTLTTFMPFAVTADTNVHLPEFGFRHSFIHADKHQMSWGADLADRNTDARLDTDDGWGFLTRDDYRISERSLDLFLSDVYQASATLSLQGDLVYQGQHRRASDQPWYDFFGSGYYAGSKVSESHDVSRLNPRLGAVWHPDDRVWWRLAWQDWLRPAGMSSLGPVATAGIPLDDRLVMRGGELNRVRLQGDFEATPATFLTGYLDYKDIDNNRFDIRPFAVSELESLGKLRPRDYGQLMREDLYEFVDTPDYAGGTIRQAGATVNHMLGKRWGVMAQYQYNDADNKLGSGYAVPYLARHTFAVGATWISPDGWYLAGRLVHRGSRYADEAKLTELDAGFTGDLDVFWQSPDKRWLLRFSANDLFDENLDSQYTAEVNYRF